MRFTKCSLSNVVRTCFCAVALAITASALQVSAQGVGIDTTTPDPSAALEIKASDKGILIPQVQLQSLIDQFTIPAPAHGLLVYHMGSNLGGKGFFYNSGLSNGPVWKRVGELTYPYYHGGSEDVLFNLENYKQNSTAIRAYSISGNALEVAGGLKIAGPGQSPGLGKVLTSDAQGNAKWEGAVAFRVHGVKDQGGEVIANDINTIVPFKEKDFDLNESFLNINTPANRFDVPKSGIYHFDTSITFSPGPEKAEGATATLFLVVTRGAANFYVATNSAVFAKPNSSIQLNTDVQLFAGDKVHLEFRFHQVDNELEYAYLSTVLSESYFSGKLMISQ